MVYHDVNFYVFIMSFFFFFIIMMYIMISWCVCVGFQLVMFNIPLTLYLAHIISVTISPATPTYHPVIVILLHLYNHSVFYIIVFLQAWFAYGGFYKAYGMLAFVVGPVRTWSIVLAVFLQQKALSVRCENYKVKCDAVSANGDASVSGHRWRYASFRISNV